MQRQGFCLFFPSLTFRSWQQRGTVKLCWCCVRDDSARPPVQDDLTASATPGSKTCLLSETQTHRVKNTLSKPVSFSSCLVLFFKYGLICNCGHFLNSPLNWKKKMSLTSHERISKLEERQPLMNLSRPQTGVTRQFQLVLVLREIK
jgi:hypothetical protein